MRTTQLFLGFQALALIGLGVAYFIRPHEMTNLSGMLLMAQAAITDVRAYYGGLQMGLGAFLLLACRQTDLIRAALILLVLIYSALALARIGGLWLDGGFEQTFNLIALLIELVSAALAMWLLRRLPS
ncbi:MAG: DUF4345 domain-containing protein [Pseudomonadaceae bacterium]|jgi:hypothetical protein|nr:DUF4345 domain-containing protein [Pseudomonadaceae bacterium]